MPLCAVTSGVVRTAASSPRAPGGSANSAIRMNGSSFETDCSFITKLDTSRYQRANHGSRRSSSCPAQRGRMSVSDLAARHRARVMPTTTRKKKDRGRRSAERRMPSIVRATIGNIAAADIATDARQRGALAFRRFAADSPRQSQPALAQPQAVFPGTRLRRVSPAFACPSPARSAQTGLFAGPTVSRAARERSANPRAGTASRSASRSASRKRPSDERDASSSYLKRRLMSMEKRRRYTAS